MAGFAAFPGALALRAEPLSIEQGYRQMYNLQFTDAHRTFSDWSREHPDDPLGPASDAAAYLFTELDRLRVLESEFFVSDQRFFGSRPAPDPAVKRSFEAAIGETEKLAARRLASNAADPDALFADLMRHGLRADYLSLVENSNFAALKETVQGRSAAERLLKVRPDYYDAYVAIGVENYLLSLKSAPLRWILRIGGAQTDKQTGLEKLRLTAEKGRYLMPFARLLLAVAALRDKDRISAKSYLSWLVREFPLNRLYREELAKL
jgi:hypothetical protein